MMVVRWLPVLETTPILVGMFSCSDGVSFVGGQSTVPKSHYLLLLISLGQATKPKIKRVFTGRIHRRERTGDPRHPGTRESFPRIPISTR